MPLSISTGISRTLGFTGYSVPVPETLKFPINSLIPYYGSSTDLGLVDWERYTAADGKYLLAATNQAQIGVSLSLTYGGSSASGFLSTAGGHGGPTITQNLYSSGSVGRQNSSGGGSHTHTMSGSNSAIMPLTTQNITLLRAVRSTRYLPPNALTIKETQPTNSTAFVSSANGNTYLAGANNLNFTAGSSLNLSYVVAAGYTGSHDHGGGAGGIYLPAGQRFYAYQVGYATADHGHTMAATFTQSVITSKLVTLWKQTALTIPQTDLIIMYVGTLASLPSSWKVCDGFNGTTNLGGYIIGYNNSSSTWNVTQTANPSTALGSASTGFVTHYHNSSYTGANLAQSSYTNVATGAQHGSLGWSHSHTSSVSASNTAYIPPRIGVAFIQYKGE
jgi:hypothetical protein